MAFGISTRQRTSKRGVTATRESFDASKAPLHASHSRCPGKVGCSSRLGLGPTAGECPSSSKSLTATMMPRRRCRQRALSFMTAAALSVTLGGAAASSWEGPYASAPPAPYYPPPPPPVGYSNPNQALYALPYTQQPSTQYGYPGQQVATFEDIIRGMNAADIAAKYVAPVLEMVVETNERLKQAKVQPNSKASVFRAEKPPTVTIRQYLDRIVRMSACSSDCLIMALVYLDRVVAKEYTNALTVHRLLLAAVMVATRRDSNKAWTYDLFRRISGLDANELKVLEKNMIEALNYNVEVTPQELMDYGRKTIGWRKQEMFRPENP